MRNRQIADPKSLEAPENPDDQAVFRLVASLADEAGIVAALSDVLVSWKVNILELDSHATHRPGGTFHVRVEFAAPPGLLAQDGFRNDLDALGHGRFNGAFRLSEVLRPKRVCVLVSRYSHCLTELLTQWHMGELSCDIPLVVSNHPDLADEVARFGVEYLHVPVEPGLKVKAEALLLERLTGRFDLIVLARYMQILSAEFLDRVQTPVINIHHSFLPAFAGPDPYARARVRGVKLIGATSHYVTEELDAGPIIEQDVARVTHRDSTEALTRAGRDLERTVLARAVCWHLEDRVVVDDASRTIVFA